ncbi:MAG: bifunctional adenosylcobinamide kinase/adenosylcobinamide-phosphate guanylyltransferase [Clostridium sp.]
MKVLVIGGSKSGKSMLGQDIAKALEKESGKLYYLATMKPYDKEDLNRIDNHLKDREGYGFTTIEESLDMKKVSEEICSEDTVLLDSITSLVTNSMFRGRDFFDRIAEETVEGVSSICKRAGSIVIVSDYVFCDGIIYDSYTEAFRRELGTVNRRLSELSDVVIECSYGNVIYHKGQELFETGGYYEKVF